jgi:hypothetical protein
VPVDCHGNGFISSTNGHADEVVCWDKAQRLRNNCMRLFCVYVVGWRIDYLKENKKRAPNAITSY